MEKILIDIKKAAITVHIIDSVRSWASITIMQHGESHTTSISTLTRTHLYSTVERRKYG